MQIPTFNQLLQDFGFESFQDLTLCDAEQFAKELHAKWEGNAIDLQSEINQVEIALAQTEGRLSDTQSDLESVREDLEAYRDQHSCEVESLEGQISDLKEELSKKE